MLEHFEESVHSADGLALMARAYGVLGQDDLQSDTLRVLALNDPKHPAIR